MILLRHLLGDALRRLRLRQGRTLREVSAAARVSLGYLSEVERGQKEASSELLASICGALGAPLSQVLREVSDNFALAELQSEPVFSGVREPSPELSPAVAPAVSAERMPAGHEGGHRVTVPAGGGTQVAGAAVLATRVGRPLTRVKAFVPGEPPVTERARATGKDGGLGTAPLQAGQPPFDRVVRDAYEITNMVPV